MGTHRSSAPARPAHPRAEPPDHIGIDPHRRTSLPLSTSTRYIFPMTDLTPIESEFATTEEAEAYDAWFRAKVERAMASKAPKIPHDQVMAEARRIIDRHRAK